MKIVAWFASVGSLLAVAAVVLALRSSAPDGQSELRMSRGDGTREAVVDNHGNLHVASNYRARSSAAVAGRGCTLKLPPPSRRYERAVTGDLVHLDTKKLGRIVRPSHRVTGERRDTVAGAGWEFASHGRR